MYIPRMDRLSYRLLLIWLALLAGLLLSQQVAPRLSYGLLVAVACGCPVVAGLLLWWVYGGLRQAWRRAQALRRAGKWRRGKPANREWTGLEE